MLANPERYFKTANGEFVFQVKVRERGFTAELLLADESTWEEFAASSSVSTFLQVMATIATAAQPAGAKPLVFTCI